LKEVTAGATTQLLVGGGAGVVPAWMTATGSGAPVRATSPIIVSPALGTPTALVGTNITGTAAGLTVGNVTTNANLTGHITSVGNAAVLGSFTLAQLNTAVTGADVASLAGAEALTNKTINGNTITAGTGTLSLGSYTLTMSSSGTLNMGGYTLTVTGAASIIGTNTGDNAANTTSNAYADSLVVGLIDDRGNYSVTGGGNAYPDSGGSGGGGAIMKGDLWIITDTGTLNGVPVGIGDQVRALSDGPGQTAANWAVSEANIGYVPLSQSLTSGYIYVGNGSNIGTAVAPSGDVTMDNAGDFTLITTQPDVHTWTLAQTFTVAPVFTDKPASRLALNLVPDPSDGSGVVHVSKSALATDSRGGLSDYDPNAPFATIDAAIAAMSAGDTLMIHGGTWVLTSGITLGDNFRLVLEGAVLETTSTINMIAVSGTVTIGGSGRIFVNSNYNTATGIYISGAACNLSIGEGVDISVYSSSASSAGIYINHADAVVWGGHVRSTYYSPAITLVAGTNYATASQTYSSGYSAIDIDGGTNFGDAVTNSLSYAAIDVSVGTNYGRGINTGNGGIGIAVTSGTNHGKGINVSGAGIGINLNGSCTNYGEGLSDSGSGIEIDSASAINYGKGISVTGKGIFMDENGYNYGDGNGGTYGIHAEDTGSYSFGNGLAKSASGYGIYLAQDSVSAGNGIALGSTSYGIYIAGTGVKSVGDGTCFDTGSGIYVGATGVSTIGDGLSFGTSGMNYGIKLSYNSNSVGNGITFGSGSYGISNESSGNSAGNGIAFGASSYGISLSSSGYSVGNGIAFATTSYGISLSASSAYSIGHGTTFGTSGWGIKLTAGATSIGNGTAIGSSSNGIELTDSSARSYGDGVSVSNAGICNTNGRSFGNGFSGSYHGVDITGTSSYHLGDAYSESSSTYAAYYITNGYARGYGFCTGYRGLHTTGGEFWGGAFSGWTSAEGDYGAYIDGGTVHLSGQLGTAQRSGYHGIYVNSGYCYVGHSVVTCNTSSNGLYNSAGIGYIVGNVQSSNDKYGTWNAASGSQWNGDTAIDESGNVYAYGTNVK